MIRDLSAEQWKVVKAAYLASADAAEPDRPRIAREHCGDDTLLHEAVRTMLAAADGSMVSDDRPHLAIGLPGSLAETEHEPLPRCIGPYKVRSLLGEGAFGVVYLCEGDQPEMLIAVKVLRPELTSRSALRRFQLEPRLMARLDHPAIARVFATGTTTEHPARPYFAMEYVNGAPISRYAASRRLPTPELLTLFLTVLDGVQSAHDYGVLHRDLKPGNILVTADGHPRILDFGLGRFIDENAPRVTLATANGHVLGTVLYASPEQLEGGHCSADIRADVYSLGVVLYEVLAGRAAFDAAGRLPHECIRMVCEDEPPRLSDIDRALRGDLELIVRTAMAKDREKRYATVSEFAADIRRFLSRQPISARPPTLRYQLSTIARRHRPAVLIAGVASLLLMVLIAWLMVTRQHARHSSDIARQTTETLLHLVTTRLGVLSGTGDERRRIVAGLAPVVEAFAARAPDDPDLQLGLARLREAQADLAQESGDKTTAEALRREAMSVLQPIWARRQARTDVRRAWTLAAIKLGDALKERGDLRSAEQWYLRAFEAEQRALRDAPDDLQLQSDQLWSLLRLGNLAFLAADHVEAARLLGQQIAQADRLLHRRPDLPSLWYARLCGAMELAACLRAHGSEADYLEQVLDAVSAGERLLALDSSNRGYTIQHGINALTAAQLLARAGRCAEARAVFARIEPICRRVVALDAGEPAGLAATLLQTEAQILDAECKPREAAAAWREAAAMLRARSERAPADQLVAREFAGAAAYAAEALDALGEHAEANALVEAGIHALRAALKDGPARPDAALQLGGLLLRGLPDVDARARRVEAMALTRSTLAIFPRDIELLQLKARIHHDLDEHAHTMAVYADLLVRPELAEHPKRPHWQQLHDEAASRDRAASLRSP